MKTHKKNHNIHEHALSPLAGSDLRMHGNHGAYIQTYYLRLRAQIVTDGVAFAISLSVDA
jgi:hypothetical protein